MPRKPGSKRPSKAKPGNKPRPPSHVPSPESRKQVETMSGMGLPNDKVALVMGMAESTLKKHYPQELALGVIKSTAQVAGFLFENARKGNVTAQIFWLKCRAGWKEQRQEIELSGAVGSYDLGKLTDKELKIAKAIALKSRNSAAGVDPGGGDEEGE